MGILQEFKIVSTGEKTQRQQKIQKGRESFRQYCNLINPVFFQEERLYQNIVCDTLQKMYEKKLKNPKTKKPFDILILNLPPGFGKSYTTSLFATWALGKNNKNQVITVSYGQDLAISFSKTVRDSIQMESEEWEEVRMSILSIGLERGMEQGMAKSILALLEEFGTPSRELRDIICSQKDQEILEKWLKTAAKAGSMEEFRSMAGI